MGKYTSVTVTGYNASPPPDDGTQVATNEITWAGIKTKIGDPLNTAIASVNTNIGTAFGKTAEGQILTKSGDYTVTTSDQGALIVVSATATITLPAAGTAGSSFRLTIKNTSTSGTVTITPNGTETIDGASTLALTSAQDVASIVSDGSNWQTVCDRITPTVQTRKNLLVNGDFRLWQRGTTISSSGAYVNNDDSYTADRWNLVSEANNTVNVARDSAAPPTGSLYNLKCTVQTANKQWGFVQIIEQLNCQRIIGSSAMHSFYAKTDGTAKINNLRAAIISWNSTADTVTSDVVATWHGSGTDPALAANWTYENTPSNLALTSSWQRFSLSASIDTSGATNVAVFIWVDDNDAAANDLLYLAQAQLEPGTTLSGFEYRPFQEEIMLASRYFWKTYDLDTTPGTSSTFVGAPEGTASTTTSQANGIQVFYPVPMRTTPTATTYGPSSGTASKLYQVASATEKNAEIHSTVSGTRVATVRNAEALTAVQLICTHIVADAEL